MDKGLTGIIKIGTVAFLTAVIMVSFIVFVNPLDSTATEQTVAYAVECTYDASGQCVENQYKTANQDPEGHLDDADCEYVSGWAKDPDTDSPITVHFYLDGPAGIGTILGGTTADQHRDDVGNHGFQWYYPKNVKAMINDGQTHTIYVYGINNEDGNNPVLSGSPISFGPCAPQTECGNAVHETGEECDDGNNVNGDGCSANCEWEEINCPGADYVFDNFNTHIGGTNCNNQIPPVDSDSVNVPVAGTYLVKGVVNRDQWGFQCQTGEEFRTEINGKLGPEVPDDTQPCVGTRHLQELGTFNFNSGLNEITMHHTHSCPPDSSTNSVAVEKICMYLRQQCGNDIKEPGEECDNGGNNGVPCTPSYGGSCTYCSSQCEEITLDGPYCGDGGVDSGYEQCEYPNTNNNNNCPQSQETCSGNQLGTRDAYGNCNSGCDCVYDSFSYSCVKGKCNAGCGSDSDCPANSCSETYNDYCSNKKLVEYDNDKIKDSTTVTDYAGNTCDTSGSCLCSDNPVNCPAPPANTYCVKDVCGAGCDSNDDCTPKCVGNVYFYGGECLGDCSCSYSTENCNNYDGWYDTGNKKWVSSGPCTEKEQKEQEYRDYSCSPSDGCDNYIVTQTQWIDTGNTKNKPDGTICDTDSGICEANDICQVGVCVEKYAPGTTECRASTGVCDVAEYCTGTSATCPADSFKANTYTCRASAGECDIEEKCTGSSADCPSDAKKPNTYVCKASAGICDVEEKCDGTNNECSTDVFKPNTTICREATGQCDATEYCTGGNAECPADSNKPDGTTCNDGLFCTEPDTCTSGECSGTAKDCSDGIGCTDDSCDEDADACVNAPNNSYCNDGLWCNGTEYCDVFLGCKPGTSPDCTDDLYCTVNEYCDEDTDSCASEPRDCSGNNITGIATCNNIPDNITYTWDYRQWFTSECNEDFDICTQGNENITHTCSVDNCSAECDDTHACEGNSCSGLFFDYCNNTKLVEYDDDKQLGNTTVSDSCDNTCQSNCICTDCDPECPVPETNEYCVSGVCGAECSIDANCNDTYCTQVSHKTYPSAVCNDECGCEPDGYPVCVVGSCGAQCDEDTDCGCSQDYCDGTTLVDYPDYGRCGTAGEEGCLCQNSTEPGGDCEATLIPYSPQCVECLNNTGCDHLDKDYCGNNTVWHDEGVCLDYECKVNTTEIEDCGEKNGIIGCGELNWACSEELNQVDCVIVDIEPKDELCPDYCSADTANYGACNSTNYMCYYDTEDCNAYDTNYCNATSIMFDNYTCIKTNNVTCALNDTAEIENCDNGLWCDGSETCENATCFGGTAPDCSDDLFCTINEYCDENQDACASESRDCSGNNITGIATCDNIPDNITYTWDYRNVFVSECDEAQDICTQGNETITHTCDKVQCDAECEQDSDCENMCVGSVRYFNGTCQGACECSYETENCDALDYYDDFVEYCNGTSHYKHRQFHNFSCSPGGCNETVSWVDETPIENCADKNGIMNDCGLMNWTCSEELNQVECVMTDVIPQEHLCFDYCDNTFTNIGSCNSTTYQCDYITENCDNGLWCDGQETCESGNVTCVGGTAPDCSDDLFCTINEHCDEEQDQCASDPRDCSINNITGIATCDNIPDNITYTWDYRNVFVSECDEAQDICTQGNETITHTCDKVQCDAECEQDSDCENMCVGDVRYYNGTCDTATACGCSWDTEDCSQFDGWYDTGNTTWIDIDSCNEKEQKEQEYRIYGCLPSQCTYSVTQTQWIDTNNTKNKPDGTVCDTDSGICEADDTCLSGICVEKYAPDTTECRASAGDCDVAEYCTGEGEVCPDNSFKPDTYQCRARADICDIEEYCTGTAAACPTDVFKPNTTICRVSTQQCDATEYCTGSSVSCPADANVTNGTTCNDGLWCTVSDVCTEGSCSGEPKDCSDGLFCTIEHCDENLDQCVDDGPRNCSANDITGIETCDDPSDNISSTWDYRQSFTSVCDENNDMCTQGNETITHICDKDECNATCEKDCNCPVNTCTEVYFDYCEGNKLVEYDNDRTLDRTAVTNSVKNLCQEDCECTNMTAECPAPPTNTYCVEFRCGANCDENSDCDDENPDTIDGCSFSCHCTNIEKQACFDTDATGPNTTNVTAIPYYNNGTVNVTAVSAEECSVIKTAEYFTGVGSAQCGANGTGTTIYPADGEFNWENMIESLAANIETQSQGTNFVCVRAQDFADNWGNCACAYFETDVAAPNTTKTFDGPYSFDVSTGITYMVVNETQINMTCVDAISVLNGTTIYYRYLIDGVVAQDWTVYTGPFKLTEKKEHTVEYYCVDAVGNKEETKTETDIVNDTIQETTKTCDGPGCSVIIPGYGNYFAVGWNTFFLPKFILDDINFNCGAEPFETEDVLASIDSADPGFDSIWYFNGNDWDYYQPGYAFNDLTSFNDAISNPYFLYMNRVDRLEINGC